MNPREVSKQLRLVQEKHKNDFTPTCGLCISDMAGDAANAIDSLISSAQFKSPGQEFLEKKFNIPICHELSQTYEELYQLAYHDPLTVATIAICWRNCGLNLIRNVAPLPLLTLTTSRSTILTMVILVAITTSGNCRSS